MFLLLEKKFKGGEKRMRRIRKTYSLSKENALSTARQLRLNKRIDKVVVQKTKSGGNHPYKYTIYGYSK